MHRIVLATLLVLAGWSNAYATNKVVDKSSKSSPYFVQIIPNEKDEEEANNQKRQVLVAEKRQEDREIKQDE